MGHEQVKHLLCLEQPGAVHFRLCNNIRPASPEQLLMIIGEDLPLDVPPQL